MASYLGLEVAPSASRFDGATPVSLMHWHTSWHLILALFREFLCSQGLTLECSINSHSPPYSCSIRVICLRFLSCPCLIPAIHAACRLHRVYEDRGDIHQPNATMVRAAACSTGRQELFCARMGHSVCTVWENSHVPRATSAQFPSLLHERRWLHGIKNSQFMCNLFGGFCSTSSVSFL